MATDVFRDLLRGSRQNLSYIPLILDNTYSLTFYAAKISILIDINKYFSFFYHKTLQFQIFVVPLQRFSSPDGGIGRRAGLKHQWGNPCRFDPGSGYEKYHNVLVSKKGEVL